MMMVWILLILLVLALAAAAWQTKALIDLRHEQSRRERAASRSADELQRQQATGAQLMAANKLASLGRMTGGIAHDVQAPLGLATGNLDVVAELIDEYRHLVQLYDAAVQYCLQPVDLIFGADKSSLDKLVKYVEDARKQLFEARAQLENSSFINDAKGLLSDSRASLSELAASAADIEGFVRGAEDSPALVDINARIDQALAMAKMRLRDRINVVRRSVSLPKLRCSPTQLDQLFLNLISNAAQAIDGKGTLTIDAKPVGDRIEISFADSGRGIADDVLPKIFDPFFSTTPGESSGLGLTIAHNIARQLGGTINVRSAPNKGSVFIVSLPVAAGNAAVVNG